MSAGALQQDVIAQNIANVDTPGYKRDVPLLRTFANELALRVEDRRAGRRAAVAIPIGPIATDVFVGGVSFDPGQGPMVETGAPLDLAIDGDGYFVVQTAQGEAYTRNGSFTLNARGELVTASGLSVLGEGGPVRIPPGARVQVLGDGTLTADGRRCGKLRVVRFEDPRQLRKVGSSLLEAPADGAAGAATPATPAAVRQGVLETSNVSVVEEMVRMLTGMRAYEACQRVVWFIDETLDKAVNDVGRVS